MKTRYAGLLLLGIVACGPDEASPPAELDEVCGEPSPFRLLELDEDEQVVAAYGTRKIGERFYFVVGPTVAAEDAEQTYPIPRTTRVIATGLCGEAPVEIARDIFSVFEDERWPGRLLGCTAPHGGEMVVLDPSGVEPPRVVSLAPACRGTQTDVGIVGVVERDDATLALALAPYPSDLDAAAVPSVVLAEPIRAEPYYPYVVRGQAVYAVDTMHDLLRIDVVTGTTAVEQPGVAEWGVTSDERILAWRDVASLTEPDPWGVGTVLLRDRSDGRQIAFEGVSLQQVPPMFDEHRLVLNAESEAEPLTRIVELPSFGVRDFPGEHRLLDELADGRLLMSSSFDGPYHLLDPLTGEQTDLSDLRTAWVSWHSGSNFIDLFVGATFEFGDESELWRVPFDGSGAVRLAHRVGPSFVFELDGRLVTPLEIDEHRLAGLIVIEPDTLAEMLVDDHVVANLGPHGPAFGLHPREIVYGVVDGDRSGVWIARLAP